MNALRRLRCALAPVVSRFCRAALAPFTARLGRRGRGAISAEMLENRQMLSGTDEDWTISLDPDNANSVIIITPTGTLTRLRTDQTALVIDAGDGNDTLTIDCRYGIPLKTGVLTFNGGDGSDSIEVIGLPDFSLALAPSSADPANGSITAYYQSFAYNSVEAIDASHFSSVALTTPNADDDIVVAKTSTEIGISGTTGGLSLPAVSIASTPIVAIDLASNDSTGSSDELAFTGSADPTGFSGFHLHLADATATFSATQTAADFGNTLVAGAIYPDVIVQNAAELDFTSSERLHSLTLNGTGIARLSPDTYRQLNLNTLTLADSPSTSDPAGDTVAFLDLGRGGMIITPGQGDVAPATVTSWLKQGQNLEDFTGDTFWAGPGIGSSTANAHDQNLALLAAGIMIGDDANGTGPAPAMQDLADLPDDAMLLRYAYYGDANLDGGVDTLDYAQIDTGYLQDDDGWYHGDFNYDGSIDTLDYGFIDTAWYFAVRAINRPEPTGSPTASAYAAYTLSIPQSEDWTHWTIDFGDGHVESYNFTFSTEADPPPWTVTHSFDTTGTMHISAMADGTHLSFFVNTIDVTVSAASPVVTATGPLTQVQPNGSYVLNLHASPGITLWTVNWRDGSAVLNVAGPNATLSHTYASLPADPIIATAFDDDSNSYAADALFVDTSPIDLTGAAVSGQNITLSWKDRCKTEEGFRIEMAEGSGSFSQVAVAPASAAIYPNNMTL